MSDILRRATEALRVETSTPDHVQANATRLRVRRSLAQRARGRRRLAIVGALGAFLFGGTTAWAIATGELARVWSPAPAASTPASSVTSVASATPSRPRGARVAPARQELAAVPSPTLAPSSQPATPPPSDHAASPPSAHTVERARRSRPRAGAEVTRTAPAAASPAVALEPAASPVVAIEVAPSAPFEPSRAVAIEALYRRAHDAHFRGNDPAAALAAWDAYLAAEPQGRFAIEARYNRALVLARLGRYRDAHAALVPFARGEIASGYRQAEATTLVARLAELARD